MLLSAKSNHQPVVEILDIGAELGGQRILEDVRLSVRAHETVAVIGPSGAGKTTLLKILATLIAPTAGMAFVEGVDVAIEALGTQATFEAALRVLRPGGHAVIAVPLVWEYDRDQLEQIPRRVTQPNLEVMPPRGELEPCQSVDRHGVRRDAALAAIGGAASRRRCWWCERARGTWGRTTATSTSACTITPSRSPSS